MKKILFQTNLGLLVSLSIFVVCGYSQIAMGNAAKPMEKAGCSEIKTHVGYGYDLDRTGKGLGKLKFALEESLSKKYDTDLVVVSVSEKRYGAIIASYRTFNVRGVSCDQTMYYRGFGDSIADAEGDARSFAKLSCAECSTQLVETIRF